jgi:hypothetical protein
MNAAPGWGARLTQLVYQSAYDGFFAGTAIARARCSVPSRTITLILADLPFSWQNRF